MKWRETVVAALVMGVVLVCAIASILLSRAATAQPVVSECHARSVDGCLCSDESQVVGWREKALAWDSFWEKGGCPESPGVVTTTGSCGLGSAAVFGIIEVIKLVR